VNTGVVGISAYNALAFIVSAGIRAVSHALISVESAPPICWNRFAHALTVGPAAFTHCARMLACVSSLSSVAVSGAPAVEALLVRKLLACPVVASTRFVTVAAMCVSPVAPGIDTHVPVWLLFVIVEQSAKAMYFFSTAVAATVVSSSIFTVPGTGASVEPWMPATVISPIALFVPAPASPPVTVAYTTWSAAGFGLKVMLKLPLESVTAVPSSVGAAPAVVPEA